MLECFYLFLSDPQNVLSQDEYRACLLLLVTKKGQLDYRGQVFGETRKRHMLFDLNQPVNMKDREFQKPEYFLVVPQRAFENKAEILRIHVDRTRVRQVFGEALHCAALSRVIF